MELTWPEKDRLAILRTRDMNDPQKLNEVELMELKSLADKEAKFKTATANVFVSNGGRVAEIAPAEIEPAEIAPEDVEPEDVEPEE